MRTPAVPALASLLVLALGVAAGVLAQEPEPAPPLAPIAVPAPEAAFDTLRTTPVAAAADSLDDYWLRLDGAWYEPLTPELLRGGLDGATLDSLASVGDRELSALLAGRRWKLSLHPLAGTTFNRCEGWRPASTVSLRRLGRRPIALDLGAGYGLARRRVVWSAALAWPLVEAVPADRPDGPPRRPWTRLALDLRGGDGVVPFASDTQDYDMLSAIVSGDDPNMYHARRAGEATLAWRPVRRLEARVGLLAERHRPLPVATDWNLSGDTGLVGGNWAAAALASRAVTGGLAWTGGRLELRAAAQWHRVTDAPSPADVPAPETASRRDFLRLFGGAQGRWIDRRGDELAARVAWKSVDRAAPLQWRSFLGGAASLRGYPVRELSGERSLLASVDARGGCDPLRAVHFPLLGRLRLQPIVFADFGWTAADAGPPSPEGTTGWRADAGVGLGRLLGFAGQGNLRFYLAKPILNGQDDRPWQLQVELEL